VSTLRRIEAVGLGDQVYESVRQAIVQGELKPGEHLRDRKLAAALGVSRTPVRDALHRLRSAGLVESRGRTGWVVTEFTERDVKELFELRRLLEPVGLERLARDPAEDAVAEIGGFFEPFSHPIPREDYLGYFARDNAFHKLLVRHSGNQRLQSFYEVIESHIDRGRHFLSTTAAGRVDATLDEHLAICRAVAERDFAAARAALIRHLDNGEELMVEYLRRRSAAP
jgi:DNA-binding GntR family transcriptional regulator